MCLNSVIHLTEEIRQARFPCPDANTPCRGLQSLCSGKHQPLVVFPAETTLIRRYPPLRLLPYLPALALAAWAEYALFDPRDPRAYFTPWRWNYAYVGLGLLIFFALLLYMRLRTPPGVVRYQTRIILLGSIITFTPLVFWIV